jgi:hypothetical protein
MNGICTFGNPKNQAGHVKKILKLKTVKIISLRTALFFTEPTKTTKI